MTTNNFRSVEERTVEASRIAREACENAYREGFEAGAKEMREKCIGIADDEDPTGIIVREINRIVLPTPTTKG